MVEMNSSFSFLLWQVRISTHHYQKRFAWFSIKYLFQLEFNTPTLLFFQIMQQSPESRKASTAGEWSKNFEHNNWRQVI